MTACYILLAPSGIIIIISGFGIYGAAVVPDSGVGNTWQHLTLVLHGFLSNGVMVMGGRIMVMGGYQIYVCMSVWDTDTTEWI